MRKDLVADGLNQIMNARRARKDVVILNYHSKFLLSVLAIAKLKGYVKDYKLSEGQLKIELLSLNFCKAIKPRYTVSMKNLDKYVKRYLPAKNLGILIVSTSQGLMTHQTAIEKKIGGSLIAYMF
jgi:small subunit ribosomal protein S8